jgi:hypothetical protein
MAKFVEYVVVEDTFHLDFDKQATRHLAAGWELYGELKIAGVYGDRGYGAGDEPIFCFAQALVRPESVPPFESKLKPETPPAKPSRKSKK